MFQNLQVFDFGLEHLVRVLARTERVGVGGRIRLGHLLRDLTGGILVPEDEDEDALQPEKAQKIPRQTRHPPDVQVSGHDSRLQHGFEADGEWEWELEDDEAGEKGIDPGHDERLRDHHGHVSLHHPHHSFHGGRIRHWIGCSLTLGFRSTLQECSLLEAIDEILFSGIEGGLVQSGGVVPQVDTSNYG